MKKTLLLILALIICVPLVSCGIDAEKVDTCSEKFITAMLARDEEGMKQYLHPDHTEDALPGDAFYENLEKYYITPGVEMTAYDIADKSYAEDTSLSGTVIKAKYIAKINELIFDVNLVLLENEQGFGVIAISLEYCTDPRVYEVSGVVE